MGRVYAGEAMASTGTLYLVDGSSFIHRAFHALPPLTNKAGHPTGAVFGFARLLLKLIKERRPDRLAVVFDSAGPTFRHQAFPEPEREALPQRHILRVGGALQPESGEQQGSGERLESIGLSVVVARRS